MDLGFHDEFEKAVEAKVKAEQDAARVKNQTVQVEEEAKQSVIKAQAEADSTLARAKAEAASIQIRAQALSQNQRLVEWEAIQKWNGTLPQYMLTNTMPFLNLGGSK